MRLTLFKKLVLRPPKLITMGLLIADHIVKNHVCILFDVLVNVDNFIFPIDFVILDCKDSFKMPIILEKLFLATYRALVDIGRGEMKF